MLSPLQQVLSVPSHAFAETCQLTCVYKGADEDMQYQHMFSQWLQPQPGIIEGNCDETYHIVESLLDVSYSGQGQQSPANRKLHPWQMSKVDAVGSMKVIRVSDVKKSGRHFFAMLESFLQQTAHANSSGPAWSGMVEADQQGSFPGLSHRPRIHWYLFAVIKDFSQDEASKKLQQNVPAWFLRRQLCSIHPAAKVSPEVSAAAMHGLMPFNKACQSICIIGFESVMNLGGASTTRAVEPSQHMFIITATSCCTLD